MNKRIVSFFFLLLFTGSIYAAIDITDLRTELLKSPEGIDVRQPRLSWRIESDEQNVIQTAYHILVASSPELLEQEKGDIWDSGKIESDASQWITYQGKTLKRNASYYWKVKIDTNKVQRIGVLRLFGPQDYLMKRTGKDNGSAWIGPLPEKAKHN